MVTSTRGATPDHVTAIMVIANAGSEAASEPGGQNSDRLAAILAAHGNSGMIGAGGLNLPRCSKVRSQQPYRGKDQVKWIVIAAVLFLSSETVIAQNLGQPSLRGTVTDPSGAAIRGADVQLRRARTRTTSNNERNRRVLLFFPSPR